MEIRIFWKANLIQIVKKKKKKNNNKKLILGIGKKSALARLLKKKTVLVKQNVKLAIIITVP